MPYPPTSPPDDRVNTTPLVDNHPGDHNLLADGITDLVTELGTDPSNFGATVQERLEDLERFVYFGIDPAGGTTEGGFQVIPPNDVWTPLVWLAAVPASGTYDPDTWLVVNVGDELSRITPDVAGWYEITAVTQFTPRTTGGIAHTEATVGRNGDIGQPFSFTTSSMGDTYSTDPMSLTTTGIIPMNGTSDYIEVFMRQDENAYNVPVLSANVTVKLLKRTA